jgi:prevent-host-death family protein
MADTVNIHEAKTHLSRLLERVRRGATIIIAKAGQPIARLVPVGEGPAARRVKEPATLPEARPGSDRADRLRRLMEQEVWPLVPPDQAGRRLTREEEDAILGYGPEGA